MEMLLAAMLLAGAQGGADPAMNASEPSALRASLSEMGYAPESMDMTSDTPSTVITSGGGKFWLAMGGCDRRRTCSYVVVGSTFTDVIDPPAAWINEQNRDLDLVKVWLNEKKEVSYAASVLTAGLTRGQFRAFMDALVESEGVLGRRAVEAKLNRR
jgi:hypothetical protein